MATFRIYGLLRVRRPRLYVVLIALILALAIESGAALAERRPSRAPPQWHGDIERFHEHDWRIWRYGRWAHTRHDGRLGWWWVVGSSWYIYPAPEYPYPSPWYPAPSIVVPPIRSIDPPPPPTQYWYYCDASRSFYPYVPNCPNGWRQVPAVPSSPPAGSPK
jgi:hypothetical protein